MQNDKSPGNDDLTKEFYETFWNKLKEIFVDSVLEAKEKGHLSIFQREAIIKLIEKEDRDKRFIKNWRLISLLNVDLKIISKALSEKLKKVLPDLISSQQTAYVKNRYIGESRRLIYDLIEIAKTKKLDGFLVAMEIEKALDSLYHDFLVLTLEKYGFRKIGKNLVIGKNVTNFIRSSVLSMVVQLQNIFHLGEELVKVTQFQLCYLF